MIFLFFYLDNLAKCSRFDFSDFQDILQNLEFAFTANDSMLIMLS
jgi:hypothetical protein